MAKASEPIVGLDLGTTKTCAVVAELGEKGIDVIGLGVSPSRGLRRGVVVNIDLTVDSIRRAVEEAELMAGVRIGSAFVGLSGSHIRGINSRGVIAVSGKDQEVMRQDIERVLEAAKAVALPQDREVLHVLPQEFIIDGQRGIKEPLQMCGVRLEAEVHIVTGAAASVQNVMKCVRRAGLEVQGVVLESLASSLATLAPDEKELGVILIDIGGGTSDVAVFVEGSLWHTAVLSIGGGHLTQDIAVGLRIPAHEAEDLKKKHGCAYVPLVQEEAIEIAGIGGRRSKLISKRTLAEIIQSRMEEIFTLVEREVRRAGYLERVTGVVVTGGSSLLEGVPELGEQVFDLPIRRGTPMGIRGLVDVVSSPVYATGVGLILYGAEDQTKRPRRGIDRNSLDRVLKKVKEWLNNLF